MKRIKISEATIALVIDACDAIRAQIDESAAVREDYVRWATQVLDALAAGRMAEAVATMHSVADSVRLWSTDRGLIARAERAVQAIDLDTLAVDPAAILPEAAVAFLAEPAWTMQVDGHPPVTIERVAFDAATISGCWHVKLDAVLIGSVKLSWAGFDGSVIETGDQPGAGSTVRRFWVKQTAALMSTKLAELGARWVSHPATTRATVLAVMDLLREVRPDDHDLLEIVRHRFCGDAK